MAFTKDLDMGFKIDDRIVGAYGPHPSDLNHVGMSFPLTPSWDVDLQRTEQHYRSAKHDGRRYRIIDYLHKNGHASTNVTVPMTA
nr:hypothetical protein CFP56_29452 [Quercus suber]